MRRSALCALFDLDDTMYPKGAGVMNIVSQRINEYMASRLGMDAALIKELRPRYWRQYGTTMRGLMVEYQIDPDDYLSYVHDFTVDELLAPNKALGAALAVVPWQRVIFTNATREHAEQVLAALDVTHFFEHIFDIRDTGYIGKPDARPYQHVLSSLGVAAQRCIALDDSLPNLRTAKDLSMLTVLVGSSDTSDGVDFVIDRIEEIDRVASELRRRSGRVHRSGVEVL